MNTPIAAGSKELRVGHVTGIHSYVGNSIFLHFETYDSEVILIDMVLRWIGWTIIRATDQCYSSHGKGSI
jgi:hypothetical protein